jgi:hypothetical protein
MPLLSFDVKTVEFLEEWGCGICYNDYFECFIDSLDFMLAEDRYITTAKKAVDREQHILIWLCIADRSNGYAYFSGRRSRVYRESSYR